MCQCHVLVHGSHSKADGYAPGVLFAAHAHRLLSTQAADRMRLVSAVRGSLQRVVRVPFLAASASARFFSTWQQLPATLERPPPDSSASSFLPDRFTYVDKTPLLAKIMAGPQYVFAPAPRRMGKSLTVKMLGAIARGEKDKFAGMAIAEDAGLYDFDKAQFSVVQLVCSSLFEVGATPQDVEKEFANRIRDVARRDLGIPGIDSSFSAAKAIEALFNELRDNHPERLIVLTIDEYDAPVNAFLPHDPASAKKMAETLAPFYTMLKDRTDDLHKVFITGVTKFSMTSMFSGPNQVIPIMERTAEFSSLYGFTAEQVKAAYGDYMLQRGYASDGALDQTMQQLVQRYNGYRFHPAQADGERSLNPFSVVSFLGTGQMDDYWCKSAVSSAMVQMLGMRCFDILKGFSITQHDLFKNVSAEQFAGHWQQTAFMSGYATIIGADSFISARRRPDFRLSMGPPNDEVREWMENDMVSSLLVAVKEDVELYASALQDLDWAAARKVGEKLLNPASALLRATNEDQVHGILAQSLRSTSLSSRFDGVFTEVQQMIGGEADGREAKRLDAALLFKKDGASHVIVLEFTYHGSVAKAAAQMMEKKYADRAVAWLLEKQCVNVERSNVHCCAVNVKPPAKDGSVELEWEEVEA